MLLRFAAVSESDGLAGTRDHAYDLFRRLPQWPRMNAWFFIK